MTRPTPFLLVLALAASLTAAACGGSSTLSSQAGPSSLGTGTSFSSGAVITGRVTGTSATSAGLTSALTTFGAQTAASTDDSIRVTVVGTGISTTVAGTGDFTLQGVPAGAVQLEFSGRGATATVTLAGVQTADRIDITVSLNGPSARVESEQRRRDRNEVEVTGLVSAVSATARTLQVNGWLVNVPATATVRHGSRVLTLADIAVGNRVEVKGTAAGTTITATEVKVEDVSGHDDDADDDDDDTPSTTPSPTPGPGPAPSASTEVELTGAVSGLTATTACPVVTFTVQGTTIRTSAATTYRDGLTCAALATTARVEVRGTRQTDNSVLANRIQRED